MGNTSEKQIDMVDAKYLPKRSRQTADLDQTAFEEAVLICQGSVSVYAVIISK